MSPWAWTTARWLEEVQGMRDIEVTWRVMCLDILHEDDETPPSYTQWLQATWKAPRAIEAARAVSGDDAARTLLFAIGYKTNVDRNRDLDAVIVEAVAECGLPVSVAQAAHTHAYDPAVRASHEAATALGGKDVGTPIIGLPGPDGERIGFFGPVVSPTPRGEAAGRLWDGLLLMAATPGFYELKKERKAKVWCD